MGELYWQALCRDVPLTVYGPDPLTQMFDAQELITAWLHWQTARLKLAGNLKPAFGGTPIG